MKTKTFQISEETKALLQTCFALPRPANNKTRNAWIAQFGVPEGDETKCPKLDTIIKNELPRDALEADRKLSRLQNFLLDAVGPLASAYNHMTSHENPDPELVQQCIQLALRIMGNTSAQFSQERRSKALARLNPDLKSLVEDEDFSKAAPFLFGSGFEKKAKERSEAVSCLRKAASAPKKEEGSSKKFFQGARSQWRGGRGSGSYNHRSDYRFHQKKSFPPRNTERTKTSGN